MKSTVLSPLLNKTVATMALTVAFGSTGLSAQAATLNNNDKLTITSGTATTNTTGTITATTGSWFGMGGAAPAFRTILSQGTQGIVIGATTTAGTYHGGALVSGDTGAIVQSWEYGGNTGSNFNTIAITGGTVAGLDMTGWKVAWSGVSSIPMGGIAWGAGYTSGKGNFVWDGVCGDSYTLDYRATVPAGDPSGFGNFQYALHLVGFVLGGTCSGVVQTNPVDRASAVDAPTTTSISVTFNEAMNPASVTSGFMTVAGGAVVVGTPVVASAGNTVFTFPVTGVAGGVTYTVTLGNGVAPTAVSGHAYVAGPAYARFFTTFADNTPPTIVSTNPANGATIPRNTGNIVVTFSEPVTNVLAGAISINNGVTVGAPVGSNSNKTWTFPITSGTLAATTTYTLSFNAGPKDPSNNPLTLPVSRTFTSTANINAPLATGDKLRVCPGSVFGMYVSAGHPTWTNLTQHNSIIIGQAQAGGGTHGGSPNGSETLAIDNAWEFFGNTGLHYTTAAVTDYGNGTLNFSGWNVSWNGIARINMGGGLPAIFTWDGVYGHDYTLNYLTIVPAGDPSNFGGVPYELKLKGKVNGGPGSDNTPCDALPLTKDAPHGIVIDVSGVGVGPVLTVNSQMPIPDDSKLVELGFSAAGRPAGFDFYKYGIITYTISGLTPGVHKVATVTITLPAALATGGVLYKINSTGYHQIDPSLYTLDATRKIVTLSVEDDGPLDDCSVGCTSGAGVIIDPLVIGEPFGTSGSATGAATGGSGGCAYKPDGKFDLGMLLALFGSLGYLGWRRARQ